MTIWFPLHVIPLFLGLICLVLMRHNGFKLDSLKKEKDEQEQDA